MEKPSVQDSLPGGDLYHHADGSRGAGGFFDPPGGFQCLHLAYVGIGLTQGVSELLEHVEVRAQKTPEQMLMNLGKTHAHIFKKLLASDFVTSYVARLW